MYATWPESPTTVRPPQEPSPSVLGTLVGRIEAFERVWGEVASWCEGGESPHEAKLMLRLIALRLHQLAQDWRTIVPDERSDFQVGVDWWVALGDDS